MGQPTGNSIDPAQPMIYRALAGVIADVGAVAKDKVNRQQGFRFRSIDDVYNALHPALAKNKVVIVPQILERTCEVVGKTKNGTDMIKVVCKIKFNFYAEDGSTVESVIVGEGLDTGDKATNKAMAIAYKYACFQVFCIPTEEMVDPDSESPEHEVGKAPVEKKASAARTGKQTEKQPDGQKETLQETGKVEGKEASLDDPATKEMIRAVRAEQKRTGVSDEVILNRRGVKAKKIEDITIGEFKYIMGIFGRTPDKKGGTA